jgi:hypothetical protein
MLDGRSKLAPPGIGNKPLNPVFLLPKRLRPPPLTCKLENIDQDCKRDRAV